MPGRFLIRWVVRGHARKRKGGDAGESSLQELGSRKIIARKAEIQNEPVLRESAQDNKKGF